MARATDIIKKHLEDIETHWLERRIEKFYRGVVAVGGLVVFAYIFNFIIRPWLLTKGWWQPHWHLGPGNQESWGQFGDFIGGVLNPVMAFGALYWLMRSVSIQRTELTATRAALEESAQTQRIQAEESAKMARINAISIILTILNSEIEAVHSKLRPLLELTGGKVPENSMSILTYRFNSPQGWSASGLELREQILEHQAKLAQLEQQRKQEIEELHKLLGRH